MILILVFTYLLATAGFIVNLVRDNGKATAYWFVLLLVSLTMMFILQYKQTPEPPIEIEVDGETIQFPKQLM